MRESRKTLIVIKLCDSKNEKENNNSLRRTGLLELDQYDQVGDWRGDHAGESASLDPVNIQIFLFILILEIDQSSSLNIPRPVSGPVLSIFFLSFLEQQREYETPGLQNQEAIFNLISDWFSSRLSKSSRTGMISPIFV